jgi:hypothetical protein
MGFRLKCVIRLDYDLLWLLNRHLAYFSLVSLALGVSDLIQGFFLVKVLRIKDLKLLRRSFILRLISRLFLRCDRCVLDPLDFQNLTC